MEFYSKSKPNLIVPEVKETVHKIIKNSPNNLTVSEKVSKMMYDFYKTFIEANKIIVLFFVIITVFLLYRYYNKKNKDATKKQETFKDVTEFKNIDLDTLNKSLDNMQAQETQQIQALQAAANIQTSSPTYPNYPTFNPSQQTNEQYTHILPVPAPAPMLPGQVGMQKGNPWTNSQSNNYPGIITAPFNVNSIQQGSQDRGSYTGLINPYQLAQDPSVPNPFYTNNFNSSTGNFMAGMVNRNQQNMQNYSQMIDTRDTNLTNSIQYGPDYLNEDSPEYEMEPPYAT